MENSTKGFVSVGRNERRTEDGGGRRERWDMCVEQDVLKRSKKEREERKEIKKERKSKRKKETY